jgi:hypothetical protein
MMMASTVSLVACQDDAVTDLADPYSLQDSIADYPTSAVGLSSPAQTPFQSRKQVFAIPTSAYSLSALPTTSVISDAATAGTHASKPSATAIAVPLALCGLIVVSALIVCARKRMFKSQGHKASDLEGSDWQAVVREKARSSVTVTEKKVVEAPVLPMLGYAGETRQEGNPYRGHTDPDVRERKEYDEYLRRQDSVSSRSGSGRCITPMRDEYFTSVPVVDYGRSGRRCGRGSRDGYYSSERRSRDGLGGVVDWQSGRELEEHRERERAMMDEERSRMRDKERRQDDMERERDYARRDSRDSQDRTYRTPRHNSRQLYPEADIYPHEYPALRHSRPLPEPMIRTSTTSTHSQHSYTYPLKTKSSRLAPHRTGVLDRQPSFTSDYTYSGWDERDERRESGYGDGNREMNELYESLHRAIGTPRLKV